MDQTGFEAWLEKRRIARGRQTSHYVRWVLQFLQVRKSRPARETWQDTLTAFTEDLAGGRYEPWQLRQAAEAVTLYCGRFCVEKATPPSPRSDGNARGSTRARNRGQPPSDGNSANTAAPVATPEARTSGNARAAAPALTHAEMLAELERLLRLRHYAASTQRTYMGWTRRFLDYVGASGERLPTDDDVQAFLSHLAVSAGVSSATQNQAFHAVLFLCRHVLLAEVGDLSGTVRAREGRKLPVVLLPEETSAVLAQLEGTPRLMLWLAYGSGLRLKELLTLRVKDLDFEACTVMVRSGKGDRDRVTQLPKGLVPPLRAHLEQVRAVHARDLANGHGQAPLPAALVRKYPNAATEWGWQFAFPSTSLQVDDSGRVLRWHMAAATVQRAMKRAVRRSGIAKPASVHSLRHNADSVIMPTSSSLGVPSHCCKIPSPLR